MVKHPQDDTKSSLTKLSDDLVSITEVFIVSDNVLFLVCVKTVISLIINFSIFSTTWSFFISLILYPLIYWKEIYIGVFSVSRKFLLFLLEKIFAKQIESFFVSHWKADYFLSLFIVFCKCKSCRRDVVKLVLFWTQA